MPKKIFALSFTDAEKLFDAEMAMILIPILVLALIIWYGLANKISLASLLGNLRPLRLLFQIVTLCAGIYLGAFLTGLFSLILTKIPKRAFYFLLSSFILMLIDVSFTTLGIYTYSKLFALVTGLLLGSTLLLFVLEQLNYLKTQSNYEK